MSNSSTLYTYNLEDFTAWDAANILEFATSQFTAIWLACNRSYVPQLPAYKANFIQHHLWEADVSASSVEQMHNEFLTNCSPNDPELRSIHQVVPNYHHDWWKDHFDTLGLEMPALNMQEVMKMAQDHFEQLPMGAMLMPSPMVTGQVDGDALFNQIVVITAEAVSTMLQLEAPIAEVAEVLEFQ
ncbi:hypothetical protein F4604DRAFT_1916571 [Suillus subluteus]|nr:hypothetical protein F4604DRAFT_1916571 [Suillus subluteus]